MADRFMDAKSMKNFAYATAALTALMNLILYLYLMLTKHFLADVWGALLALLFSLLYVLSFFKREESIGISQHIWMVALNAALVYSSITGTNAILDAIRPGSKNTSLQSTQTVYPMAQTASLFSLEDLKYLLFPTHAWFNPAQKTIAEANLTKNEAIKSLVVADSTTHKANATVAQAKQVISTLAKSKSSDSLRIDYLTRSMDTLTEKYKTALFNLKTSNATVLELTNRLKVPEKSVPVIDVAKVDQELENQKLKEQQHEQQKKQFLLLQQQQQFQQQQQQQQFQKQQQQFQIQQQQQQQIQQ